MKKVILFPFDISEDNRKRYCDTMEKARAENAELVLFTSIPETAKEEKTDSVYFHLLELNGYYQTLYNNWNTTSDILTKRIIQSGELLQNLSKFIAQTQPDSIIINNNSLVLNQERIAEILE